MGVQERLFGWLIMLYRHKMLRYHGGDDGGGSSHQTD